MDIEPRSSVENLIHPDFSNWHCQITFSLQALQYKYKTQPAKNITMHIVAKKY